MDRLLSSRESMMARAQEHIGRMRVPWTEEEDRRLVEYMQRHDERGRWSVVPNLAGLNRTGKSCRLRWTNYLRPDIKRGPFSEDEVATILSLQSVHGNKWATIAAGLPGRTDTEIKNLWNTRLKKKLLNKETPPVLQQLVATAELLASAVNDLKDKIIKLHSDPDGIGSLFANIPNATSITAASSETSMVNQVLEIGEITPSDQEIDNPSSSTSTTFEAWPALLTDNDTSDFFCGDISIH